MREQNKLIRQVPVKHLQLNQAEAQHPALGQLRFSIGLHLRMGQDNDQRCHFRDMQRLDTESISIGPGAKQSDT